MFFLWGLGMMVVGGLGENLVDDIVPLVAMLNHAVDGAPIGQTANIAVVDKQIDLQLAREVGIVIGGLLGVVAIDGVELESTLATPIDCLIEQLALAD